LLIAGTLGHDHPQHHIEKDTHSLNKCQQDECDADPERIDVKASCQPRANTAQDAV
jgi:hypothetical protein